MIVCTLSPAEICGFVVVNRMYLAYVKGILMLNMLQIDSAYRRKSRKKQINTWINVATLVENDEI